MIAKLAIVEEECNESAYWLEMVALANILTRERVDPLHREASEILAMTVASRKTLKNA